MKIKILKEYQIQKGTPVNVGDGIVLEATEKTTLYEEIWSCDEQNIIHWFIDWFMDQDKEINELIGYCLKKDLCNILNTKSWHTSQT